MNTATASIAATTWCASRCARTTTVSSCSSAAASTTPWPTAIRLASCSANIPNWKASSSRWPRSTARSCTCRLSRRHPQAEHLLERFDLGMQRILASGEYQKILDGWSQAADATP
ncbi:hypothetical protein ACPA9J_19425 [Pseudomonas aeruginosa]